MRPKTKKGYCWWKLREKNHPLLKGGGREPTREEKGQFYTSKRGGLPGERKSSTFLRVTSVKGHVPFLGNVLKLDRGRTTSSFEEGGKGRISSRGGGIFLVYSLFYGFGMKGALRLPRREEERLIG